MQVTKINGISYKADNTTSKKEKKREFIDVIEDAVKNPRDVNDCVAVPRGIFKAYLLIMSGSAILALSNLVPVKNKAGRIFKNTSIAAGWILNTLSAVYFAKPFAFKGVSPTVRKEDL